MDGLADNDFSLTSVYILQVNNEIMIQQYDETLIHSLNNPNLRYVRYFRNDCNNFSVDGKIDDTPNIAHDMKYTCMMWCTVHFFRGIPPSTEKELLLFVNI